MEQARTMAMEKIKSNNSNTNGASSTTPTNGDAAVEYDLRVPHKAIVEGAKTVQSELEKVCDIVAAQDEK